MIQMTGDCRQELTLDEFRRVNKMCENSCPNRGILFALCMPVRTNQNFFYDLISPIFFNQVVAIEKSVGRYFELLVALFLDMITLPIRFITAFPRIIYNATKSEHPLHQYLRQKGVREDILQGGYVYLHFTGLKESEVSNKVSGDDNHEMEIQVDINLIDVPPRHRFLLL